MTVNFEVTVTSSLDFYTSPPSLRGNMPESI